MNELTNIAVIGCGYWGPNLIRNFNRLPDCHVKWICDLDEARLAHISAMYPTLRTTRNYKEVVDDPEVDAVAIATPVATHYEFARESLLSGKHTFIEKPMARSSEECEALIELSDSAGLALMVGHTFIYTPAVRKMKEVIDSGEIGDVLYISSRRLNLGLFQKDINVVWDLAPHDISIILYILQDTPRLVNCQGKAHVAAGIEDITNMSIAFSKGGFATIHSSWLDPNKVRSMTVVGSSKMLVYDDIEPHEKIKIYDKRVEAPPYYDDFGGFQYAYYYGGSYSPFLNQEEPLKIECQHFLEYARGDMPCESSGIEGLKVVRILEAANASLAQNGSAIDLSIHY